MAPPRKNVPRVVTGPYCDRCNRPIIGPVIEVGFRDRCVSCMLRGNVLVNYAIRQQTLVGQAEPSASTPANAVGAEAGNPAT